jgi:hypothetical protein
MSLSQEAKAPTEGGLLNHRVEFVRENQIGVTPTDPAWELFSDVMINIWNWQPDASVEPQRGIGHVDPQDFFSGPEEHEVSFQYHMQKWFVDENGEPNDALYDFFFRDDNGNFNATHTVVGRETHTSGGTAGAGFRTFTVGTGGYPSEAEAEADASESMPLPPEITYQFERVRSYVVNQPAAATTLTVASTDAADTTQSVTIEDEGAATSETVTLNGTTAVATTAEYGDIDAISLDTDAVGDVVVSVNGGDGTTPTEGTTLAEIPGRDTNSPAGATQLDGGLGVPALGAGSHPGQVQPRGQRTWQHFRGDRIERVANAPIGPRINSATLSVDNNVDSNERQKSTAMALDRGVRDATLEASIAGPKAASQAIMDHLQTVGGDVEWEFSSGNVLRFPAAVVTEPGELAPESSQVALYVDCTYQGVGIEATDGSGTVLAD